MSELKKLQIKIGNTGDEVIEIRREVSRGKVFYPNIAIRPNYLNEDANLVDIKSWIIEFKHYINAGYHEDVLKKGHYIQMRPILDRSWAIALYSQDANENDLETLCNMLLDEGKSRMPRHQRQMQFLKAKRHRTKGMENGLRDCVPW